MDKLNKLTAPATEKIRQIQKMVQDIKKNDGSIMNRLKRFQNEQAALIRKTGKSTWDRLKSKPPPKVPVRDYNPDDDVDEDELSESEFDSDTYEDPLENQDDSYEPPPSEHSSRTFGCASARPFRESEYLDHRDSQHTRSAQTSRKPVLPPEMTMFQPDKQDQEDYISPEDEDDNYIDPTEKPVSGVSPAIHGPTITMETSDRPPSPDVYEVPDLEENCTSQNSKISSAPLRASAAKAPPVASPRILSKKPPPNQESDIKCEQKDKVEGRSMKDGCNMASAKAPVPLPRDLKKSSLSPNPKIVMQNTESEGRPVTNECGIQHESSAPLPSKFGIIRSSVAHDTLSRGTNVHSQSRSSETDKDAGVYQKIWYAGPCDRKKAEAVLTRSDKDGSFLVRQSSGHDVQQPYTLVVFYRKRVYNIPIRFIQASHQYALGKQKKGEERFSSVSSIIEHHQRSGLILIDSQNNTTDCTKLRHPVQI